MNVNEANQSARNAGLTGSVQKSSGVSEEDRASEVSPTRSGDRVEISEEARILASREESMEGSSLDPETLDVLRSRVEDGFYDTAEIKEEVARRILASGDL